MVQPVFVVGVACLADYLVLQHDTIASLTFVKKFLDSQQLVVHFVVVQLVKFLC